MQSVAFSRWTAPTRTDTVFWVTVQFREFSILIPYMVTPSLGPLIVFSRTCELREWLSRMLWHML